MEKLLTGKLQSGFYPNFVSYENAVCLSETLFEQQAYTNVLIQSIVLILGLSFGLVPIVSTIVREREPQADTKYMQQLSGVKMWTYWLANLLWDWAYYLFAAFLASICYAYYPKPTAAIATTVVWHGVALILVFAFVIVPISYTVSFHFRDHSKAFIFVIVLNLVTGAGLTVINSLLIQVSFRIGSVTSPQVAGYVDYALNFFPPYAFTFGLVNVLLFYKQSGR